jgi:hypothetical protein
MTKKHALAGIITDRHTSIIHAVVDKVIASPGEEYFAKLFPAKNVYARNLIHERLSGYGGFTGERNLNEKGKPVSGRSRDSRLFKPGFYQEHIRWNEDDLINLRKAGTLDERAVKGPLGVTAGELDELSAAAMKLQRRVVNRWNKLGADAIFNGTFVWKSLSYDFEVPAGNRLTAPTDWSDPSAGTPLSDLWAYQNTDATVRKYKIKRFVINPKTATDIMVSDEVRNVLKNYNLLKNDINIVAQFLFPGLAEIYTLRDAYQDETIEADGTVTMGAHTFFMPDDKVFIEIDFAGMIYPIYGNFCLTENLNDPSASIEKPAVGLYTYIDEKGLEERESPYVKLVTGFNGGPNLLRSDDVLTISV